MLWTYNYIKVLIFFAFRVKILQWPSRSMWNDARIKLAMYLISRASRTSSFCHSTILVGTRNHHRRAKNLAHPAQFSKSLPHSIYSSTVPSPLRSSLPLRTFSPFAFNNPSYNLPSCVLSLNHPRWSAIASWKLYEYDTLPVCLFCKLKSQVFTTISDRTGKCQRELRLHLFKKSPRWWCVRSRQWFRWSCTCSSVVSCRSPPKHGVGAQQVMTTTMEDAKEMGS